jgi:hypothetical protein
MRGPTGDRKIERFSRSGSVAGKNGRGRRTAQAREDAEIRKVELETEKLAGENAQQPLRVGQLEAQIAREEAEARATEFGTFRDKVLLILFLVLLIFILTLALVNPQLLEAIGQALPWISK